jgi:hypothetical protein
MTRNILTSKVFIRILGFQVGNKVGFIDWRNIPQYGIVVEADSGLLWIRFYRNGIKYSAVRYETEVKLLED